MSRPFSRTKAFRIFPFKLSTESCMTLSLFTISNSSYPSNNGLLGISDSFTKISMSNDSATNALVVWLYIIIIPFSLALNDNPSLWINRQHVSGKRTPISEPNPCNLFSRIRGKSCFKR